MHFLQYVLINGKGITNSATARAKASRMFGRHSSYFGCDWFEIGGRWTGHLELDKLDKKKMKQFYKIISWQKGKPDLSSGEVFKEFGKLFPERATIFALEDGFPYHRDKGSATLKLYGYEDDGQLVDDEIWAKIISPAIKQQNKSDYNRSDLIVKLPLSKKKILKKDTIGKKWIVVIDYHS